MYRTLYKSSGTLGDPTYNSKHMPNPLASDKRHSIPLLLDGLDIPVRGRDQPLGVVIRRESTPQTRRDDGLKQAEHVAADRRQAK